MTNITVGKKTIFILQPLFIVALIFPFFSNVFLLFNQNIYRYNLVLKIVIFVVFAILFLFRFFKTMKVDKLFICLLALMSSLFFSTLYNQGNMFRFFGFFITCFGMYLFVNYFHYNNPFLLLKGVSYYFRIVIYLNFILLLAFPQGIYYEAVIHGINQVIIPYGFFGLYNQASPAIIAGIIILLYEGHISNGKLKPLNFIDIIISAASILIMWSATGLTGLIIVLALFMCVKLTKAKFTLKTGYLVVFVLFLLFVIFRWQNIFSFFISNVLNRSLTFTNRTVIWDSAMQMITERFLIGYGIGDSESIVYFVNILAYRDAHNMYLQFMLSGGIIFLVCFIALLFMTRKALIKNQNQITVSILSIGIFSILLMGLFESYGQIAELYLMICLAYYGYDRIAAEKLSLKSISTSTASKSVLKVNDI